MNTIDLPSAAAVAAVVAILFIFHRLWLSPLREKRRFEERKEIIERYCPQKLIDVMWTYRKDDEVQIPYDASVALIHVFGIDAVALAMDIVKTGRVVINHKDGVRYLEARFKGPALIESIFGTYVSSGKTGL